MLCRWKEESTVKPFSTRRSFQFYTTEVDRKWGSVGWRGQLSAGEARGGRGQGAEQEGLSQAYRPARSTNQGGRGRGDGCWMHRTRKCTWLRRERPR